MLKSVKTHVVWDVLTKDQRVAYVLPPYYAVTNEHIQTYCNQTLQAILAQRPKYLLLIVPNPSTPNPTQSPLPLDLLYAYETFFQAEIQILPNLSALTDPDFLEHHTPLKTYLPSQPITFPSPYIDLYISDNLTVPTPPNLPLDKTQSGKITLEEFINHNFYLNKLMTRLEQPLSMHQSVDTDYDIALVLGEDIPSPHLLTPHITNLIKHNQCSAIYSINQTLLPHLKTFKRTRFPLVLHKEIKTTPLLETLKKVSLNYTTVLFLGKLNVPSTKELETYLSTLHKHALFDPYAYDTLLKKQPNPTTYRLTIQPTQLLQRFLSVSQ
jgi:hypothetical protein